METELKKAYPRASCEENFNVEKIGRLKYWSKPMIISAIYIEVVYVRLDYRTCSVPQFVIDASGGQFVTPLCLS